MKNRKRSVAMILALLLVVLLGVSGEAGWRNTSSGRRYYLSSGRYVTSQWYQIKKKWFYFDACGRMKTGRFKVGNDVYYVKRNSGRVCNQQIGSYYYGSDGKMLKSTWKKIRKYWFYFGKNGKICYGRFQADKKWYYCRKKTGKVTRKRVGVYYYDQTGAMVTDQWIDNFYYGANGKVKVGKFVAKDGKTYYCTRDTGKVTSRWVNKNYYGRDGAMAVSCWIQDSYVDETGMIIRGNRNPVNPPTKEEIRWLSAITYLEAGNQSYYGKQCVASVVMNRVKSKKFPNTIKGVLFQSGQFTPAANGSLSRLFYNRRSIQAQSVRAAKYVLEHGSVLRGYYYFNTFSGRIRVGDHYFT